MLKNKANRECCDVDIRIKNTLKPYLFFDTANTTGLEITSDDTYAMSKGSRAIAFSNPMESTFTIAAQVLPLKLYAMLSDGQIETTAIVADKTTIKCETAGELTLPDGVQTGTVFVYKAGEYAETAIEGTVANKKFTATTADAIAIGEAYDVGYLILKDKGVHKVSFNDKKNPQDYYITLLTNDKDEDGIVTAKKIVVYKAKPQKSLNLSYSSEDDPISVELTFTALKDKDGNIIDMVDFDDEE